MQAQQRSLLGEGLQRELQLGLQRLRQTGQVVGRHADVSQLLEVALERMAVASTPVEEARMMAVTELALGHPREPAPRHPAATGRRCRTGMKVRTRGVGVVRERRAPGGAAPTQVVRATHRPVERRPRTAVHGAWCDLEFAEAAGDARTALVGRQCQPRRDGAACTALDELGLVWAAEHDLAPARGTQAARHCARRAEQREVRAVREDDVAAKLRPDGLEHARSPPLSAGRVGRRAKGDDAGMLGAHAITRWLGHQPARSSSARRSSGVVWT